MASSQPVNGISRICENSTMDALHSASVLADCFMASDLWVPRLDVDDLFWPEQQPVSPVGSCDAVDMDVFASCLDELAQYESVAPSAFKDLHFVAEPPSETKSGLKRKRVEAADQSLKAQRKSAKTTAARQLKSRKRVSTSVRVREEMKALRGTIEQLQLELEDLSNSRETRVCKKQDDVARLAACSEAALELENACLRELVASQRTVIARAESLVTQSWQPLNVTLEHTLY